MSGLGSEAGARGGAQSLALRGLGTSSRFPRAGVLQSFLATDSRFSGFFGCDLDNVFFPF